MGCSMVIFGASGDLTRRKLVPALYWLFARGRLPDPLSIIGFSRSGFSHEAWREALAETTAEHVGDAFDAETWSRFAERIYYQPGDIQSEQDVGALESVLGEIEQGTPGLRVYYLATAPRFFEPAIHHLGSTGLAHENGAPRRVVVEKPFGTDQATARALNRTLHEQFAEHQVYRIDHYLGKETVQNIMVLRFANIVFEPIWSRNYIDHVQITASEEVTVGQRGGYYDAAGVLRDMFQNHLLQLLAITAMEAPPRSEPDLVRNEKVKVLSAIRPMTDDELLASTVRGQYDGYLKEPGVAPDSRTATFAAVKLQIDNWRWQGVPFYLRSGKGLDCRSTQIVIQFREPPHMMFETQSAILHDTNRLVIQIQPAEGLQLHLQTKVPDSELKLRLTDLDFRFDRHFRGTLPDAYERLLLDVLAGDASLFSRSDEVELAWGIIDPILAAWQRDTRSPLATYDLGGWGPDESRAWIEREDRRWYDVCPVLG